MLQHDSLCTPHAARIGSFDSQALMACKHPLIMRTVMQEVQCSLLAHAGVQPDALQLQPCGAGLSSGCKRVLRLQAHHCIDHRCCCCCCSCSCSSISCVQVALLLGACFWKLGDSRSGPAAAGCHQLP